MVPSLMLRMKGCLVAPVYSTRCFFTHLSITPFFSTGSIFFTASLPLDGRFIYLFISTRKIEFSRLTFFLSFLEMCLYVANWKGDAYLTSPLQLV